ncbi:C-type lectin 1-like [Centropristis striata]|uniref:C-type lectin 1-like n=1 Tax=Centropristis striata TaxID=184440 RepID=UPI0027DF34FA|nr:C-type lectin 1-like [Centropristis striata]
MDVRGTNATFAITPKAMNWTEAQSYCREHHTDLASVRNQAENLQVKNMMTTDYLWIGLVRNSWEWSDGSNSSFRFWSSGKPSSLSASCVAADFSNSGKWANHYCHLRKPFICFGQSTTKQVIKLRMKTSSSVDLNDQTVMDDIMKQMKQRLKNQGLDDNIKLSWKKQADGKVFHKEEKKNTKKRKDEF